MNTSDCIAIKNDDEIDFLDANESLILIEEFNQQISVCLENVKLLELNNCYYIEEENEKEFLYNASVPDAVQPISSIEISKTEYTYDESIANTAKRLEDKSSTLEDGVIIDLLEDYVCEFCFKSFAKRHHLKSHLSVHTDVYKKTLKKQQKLNVFNKKSKNSKLKKRKVSGSSVSKKPHARLTRAVVNNLKRITQNEKIGFNKNGEENIALSTKLCNKDNPLKERNKFTNDSQQKQGLKDSNTKKKYPKCNITQMDDRCAICNKLFSIQQDLIKHAQEIHSKEKALKCRECNECFSDTSSLLRHLKFHKEIPEQSVRKTRSSKMKDVQIESQELNKSNEIFLKENDNANNLKKNQKNDEDSLKKISLEKISSINKTQRMRTNVCNKPLEISENECNKSTETIIGKLDKNLTSIDNTHGDSKTIDKPKCRKNATRVIGKQKCKFCSKTFRNNSILQRHITIHTGERPYSCSICNITIRRKDAWKDHQQKHLDPIPLKIRKKYKCDFCSKSLFKINLKEHIMIHTGERPFSCTLCKESFKRKIDLKKHQQRHSNPKSKTVLDLNILDKKCAVCIKVIYNKKDLIKHVKEVHTSDCRPFKCQHCDSTFSGMGLLRRHYKITHVDESENHLYTCSICKKTFLNSYKLNCHEKHHLHRANPKISHIVTKNKCAICYKTFNFHLDLTEHVRQCHPKSNAFKCRDCDRAFTKVSSVVYHYKMIHKDKLKRLDTEGITKSECHKNTKTNKDQVKNSRRRQLASNIGKKVQMEKNYVCKMCNRSFDLHNNLKRHLVIHDAENPFFCSLCEKPFINENNLKWHLEKHLRNARQKNI